MGKKQKPKQINILLLEDSPADAEMIAGRLQQDGIEFSMRTVDTGEAYERELAGSRPDIILADYHLPLFDGPGALVFASEKYPEIPFIFVTGAIGEEKAVETLQNGATDFVLKDNMARLGPAIQRAIREKNLLRDRHSLFAALKDNEERFKTLTENLSVGLFRTTISQPGRFLQTNLALARMHGVDSVEELMRIPLADLFEDPSERAGLLAELMENNFMKGREIRFKTKSGGTLWGSVTAACHRNHRGNIDWIEGIIEDVTERRQAEEVRRKTLRQQEGINLLQQSLLTPAPLDRKLKSITDGIVRIFDADFCRIWMIKPGDLCERGCVHEQAHEGPHVCRYRDRCLHLVSSSGRYTHTDGESHRRVPFGCYKIGLVASGEEHKFITNDVRNDPRVHNREWARDLGLVSFAGYQLRVTGGYTIGVLALFARHPISPEEDAILDGLSSTAALIIQQAESHEALGMSEEKFRRLFESSHDAIMILEPPSWLFTSVNSATVIMFGAKSMADIISRTPGDFSPEHQPDGSASAEKAGDMIETAMRTGSLFFEWTHMRIDGKEFPATVLLTRVDLEGKKFLQATVRDITGQKQAESELRRKNEELDLLLNSIASIIIGVSVKDRITHWNPFAEEVFGIKAKDIVGKQLADCALSWDWKRIYLAISDCIAEDTIVRMDDVTYVRIDGKDGILGLTINPLKRGGDVLEGFIILGRDLTERRILENQLQQARKLEAIGQLAAGVAHEINSPMQYVGDNLNFISKSYAGYRELLEKYEELVLASGKNAKTGQLVETIREIENKIDTRYLREEMPRAIAQSLEGVDRVSKIVKSMKAFAHPGTDRKMPADINQSIENTITVSKNEWKYVADVETDFDPGLLPVPCFAAELNQVILNMIVNAVDAIKEAREKKTIDKGIIRISTKMTGGFAEIRVSDNGAGIPKEIRQKVFDPFFTTKEVGQGSGQGLSIAHAIIATKHGGTLRFETETSRGTTFIITLPLADTRKSM